MTSGGYCLAMFDLVHDRWPVLSAQVAAALQAVNEPTLEALWPSVRIVERCGCGDDYCQSFYTQPRPVGTYGVGHRNVMLDAPWDGYLILDVVDETIMHVEILHRPPLN
jgi:hypothetical protein